MSFSVGFPNASGVTIGGQSSATIKAMSEAASDAAKAALGVEAEDDGTVRTGPLSAQPEEKKAENSNQSIAVKTLLKRMQELQEQLQRQQQQLAAAEAASYPTEEARTATIMAMQSQIGDTNGALAQVTGNLVKELAKDTSSGSVINTTA
ncbi:hypothetical protein RG836_22960 [Pseudomonas sp. SZMC_28357]|uniref:hypothetical protein n=1 Tax=Pseudomonas sp. SZMC_28357 TaxID=3074380 RepID=UPI00287103DD|nr:hypothetical protein [Pseudomonas sp. SZMC_28357]MDR9754317.1 hypothetical protein [Pseudomonas sp. SZMC_28357]